MAHLTPSQMVWRERIEAVLRLAAPALDLVLAAGDRLSRVVDREELDAGAAPAQPREPWRRAVGPGTEQQQAQR